jgi:hypothetical protein
MIWHAHTFVYCYVSFNPICLKVGKCQMLIIRVDVRDAFHQYFFLFFCVCVFYFKVSAETKSNKRKRNRTRIRCRWEKEQQKKTLI